ncbi:MAG: hypothetical protein MK185_00165 [Saccharospirillaceae bacterium]|nr:hypothetical protein A3759_17895 [Thalassolituus sp. HI0120]KZZ49349.1 hypothetical protein A3759_26495 [Thalassolituus sp. HI0120]MCH2039037.1 hypothetical protein [Saccharospirillaceae bacterium]
MTDVTSQEQPTLDEQIAHLEDEIHRISNKLNNSGFVSKAPAATIEKEKNRLESFEKDLLELQAKVAS